MNTAVFLVEWALRSSVLIGAGGLLLWGLRVRNPAIRLAGWTAMLIGSLAMPAMMAGLPAVRFAVRPAAAHPGVREPAADATAAISVMPAAGGGETGPVRQPFDWARAAAFVYLSVAFGLLGRLLIGLGMSLRLLRMSAATRLSTEEAEVRESVAVAGPVTLGIMQPAIVLPAGWPLWPEAKLAAVLAHERSHLRRRDPVMQLLSGFHRAVLWHSPMSWFLHRRIVRVAEEVSDDAAVATTGDRAFYAEVLLQFMQLSVRAEGGVPMARYGKAEDRIHRILSGTVLSKGLTRWSLAAILAIGSPLAFVAAAGRPGGEAQEQTPRAPVNAGVKPDSETAEQPNYVRGLGSVTPLNTVQVKSRVDGELLSVSFQEGQPVKAGQVIATVDSRQSQIELAEAEALVARDQAELIAEFPAGEKPRSRQQLAAFAQSEARLRTDQARVGRANLRLAYAQITAPITGIAGLRLIDAGNMVHAGDAKGIVVITQLQPIAVVFTLPEDLLPAVRARQREGSGVPVEAWNRQNSARIATGKLDAVDNQMDTETGTIKLKALFDNMDEALFPGQFVNVRMPHVK